MKPHAPPFLLRDLKIEVTHRCTLACIHSLQRCEAQKIASRCVSRIASESSQRRQVWASRPLAFSGGEPLVWRSLDRAVAASARCGMKVTVYTAGNVDHFATTVSTLKAAGLSRCVFSIFGRSAFAHERVTRFPGEFQSDDCVRACSPARRAGA